MHGLRAPFFLFLLLAFLLISCSTKKTYENKDFYNQSIDDELFLEEEAAKYHIKVPNRWEIKKYIYYYTRVDRTFMRNSLERSRYFLPTVKSIFRKYGIPQDLAYLPIIESGYNPYATSSTGAAGIWQFVYTTGKRFGLRIDRRVDERRDPYKSTIAAAKYLKYLYSIFKRWDLVLAAYNCGEGCVLRKVRKRMIGFWQIKYKLPKQTRNYVPKFFAALMIAKNSERYGFRIPTNQYYILRKHAKVSFHLKTLARRLDINYPLLKMFNAHLKRGFAYRGIGVNIPRKTKSVLRQVSIKYINYVVKKGDTLYRISKRFKVPIRTIMKVNALTSYNIKVGQTLKIPVRELQ